MITNIEDAQHELEVSIQETVADLGLESGDEIAYDMVVSTAWNCDDATARELCRTQLGLIPRDLEGRLGQFDWLDS